MKEYEMRYPAPDPKQPRYRVRETAFTAPGSQQKQRPEKTYLLLPKRLMP